jgi:acyl-CoA thioesterase FadM
MAFTSVQKILHADISTVLVDLDSMKPKTIEPELRDILEQFLSG